MSNIDLPRIRTTLDEWAQLVTTKQGAENVYLFGSLVYRDGAQFTALSDVDLAVKFGSSMSAIDRANWVEQLLPLKKQLEITLLGLLERRIVEPFASVVTITQAEIDFDVQKENQPAFYSSNIFIDLLNGAKLNGLPGAGSAVPCDRLMAGSISMTQKLRHQFLSVAANNRSLLQPFDGEDGVPKAIMRAAAMARRLADSSLSNGAEYDTRLGLDHLTHYLLDHEKDDSRLEDLSRLVSERRGARGIGGPISPFNQLLLAEIVFDLATKATGEMAVIERPPSPPPVASALAQGPKTAPGEDNAASDTKRSSATTQPEQDCSLPVGDRYDVAKERLPSFAGNSSLAFFGERFQQAFPGVRGLTWFNDAADAIDRLARLLKLPLKFSDAAPIWWWRDGNLDIRSFKHIEGSNVLINHEELKIQRIAAVPGPSYKWNFVYVEVDAMPPTGLYESDPELLAERVNFRGYAAEEYGLYDGHHIFNRSEYDDGGTYIDGKYIDTTGNSTLRIRYLTPYNFIIAAQASPVNNKNFDRTLVEYMNRALQENTESVVEELSAEVAKLPLQRFR